MIIAFSFGCLRALARQVNVDSKLNSSNNITIRLRLRQITDCDIILLMTCFLNESPSREWKRTLRWDFVRQLLRVISNAPESDTRSTLSSTKLIMIMCIPHCHFPPFSPIGHLLLLLLLCQAIIILVFYYYLPSSMCQPFQIASLCFVCLFSTFRRENSNQMQFFHTFVFQHAICEYLRINDKRREKTVVLSPKEGVIWWYRKSVWTFEQNFDDDRIDLFCKCRKFTLRRHEWSAIDQTFLCMPVHVCRVNWFVWVHMYNEHSYRSLHLICWWRQFHC